MNFVVLVFVKQFWPLTKKQYCSWFSWLGFGSSVVCALDVRRLESSLGGSQKVLHPCNRVLRNIGSVFSLQETCFVFDAHLCSPTSRLLTQNGAPLLDNAILSFSFPVKTILHTSSHITKEMILDRHYVCNINVFLISYGMKHSTVRCALSVEVWERAVIFFLHYLLFPDLPRRENVETQNNFYVQDCVLCLEKNLLIWIQSYLAVGTM